jgi:hypothetical protein
MRGFKTYSIMWPKYIYSSFNFVGTGWIFQNVFLQSCICLQNPILRHPIVTSKTDSYLQNSNSTFFPVYAYDYRQHTTSPFFTYSILIKTQPKHTHSIFVHLVTDKRRAQISNTMVLRMDQSWCYVTCTFWQRLEHASFLFNSQRCLGIVSKKLRNVRTQTFC